MADPSASPAALRSRLEAIALAGEGWGALLREVAAATGRSCVLVGVHGGPLATSEPGDRPTGTSVPASGVPASDSTEGGLDVATVHAVFDAAGPVRVVAADGSAACAAAVMAGARRVGVLLVAEPVDETREAMLEAAIVPIAIEATRRDAEAAAIAESASRLLDELRFGSGRDTGQLVRAAQRFGLALDRPHAAAGFAYAGANRRAWATAVRWIEMPIREDLGRVWTVLAGPVAAELHRIRRRLEGIVGDAPVLAATGPTVTDPAETPRSFREAEVVLAMLGRRTGEVVLCYEDLGAPALLLAVPADRLQAYVDAHLGPVLERPDLLETLRAWYATQGSRAAVAEQLGIHRNSVGYRIGRLRHLLGCDPLDPPAARRLQTALDAADVLQALTDLDV
jgi:hypothetical protein